MHAFLENNHSNCGEFSCGRDYKDPDTWGTLPFTTHRDADCLTESNFHVIFDDLYSEFKDDVLIETYNHWGFGWVSVIRINMNNALLISSAEKWVEKLDDYPIADEYDYSRREYECQLEAWDSWLAYDVQRLLQENELYSLCEDFEWKEGAEEKVKELVYNLIKGEDCYFNKEEFLYSVEDFLG